MEICDIYLSEDSGLEHFTCLLLKNLVADCLLQVLEYTSQYFRYLLAIYFWRLQTLLLCTLALVLSIGDCVSTHWVLRVLDIWHFESPSHAGVLWTSEHGMKWNVVDQLQVFVKPLLTILRPLSDHFHQTGVHWVGLIKFWFHPVCTVDYYRNFVC